MVDMPSNQTKSHPHISTRSNRIIYMVWNVNKNKDYRSCSKLNFTLRKNSIYNFVLLFSSLCFKDYIVQMLAPSPPELYTGDAYIKMVIVVVNGYGNRSSNPGQGYLHFT